MKNLKIGVLDYGMYMPENIISNKYYESYLETTSEWIKTRTGMLERRYASKDQWASDLAVLAIKDMLKNNSDALNEVDCVICATSTPDTVFPSTAALIAGQFGLKVAAFDISVACSGFVYALSLAYSQIKSGIFKKVLVIGTEVLSKVVDKDDRNTVILFGDGAGVFVIGAGESKFTNFVLGADAKNANSLVLSSFANVLPDGSEINDFINMNGREVFKFAVRIIPQAIEEVLLKANLSLDEIDWIVPHQANIRIIEAASEKLNISMDKFIINLDRYGNTSAATIPTAFIEARRSGKIKKGDNVILVAFGGGLSWAALHMIV